MSFMKGIRSDEGGAPWRPLNQIYSLFHLVQSPLKPLSLFPKTICNFPASHLIRYIRSFSSFGSLPKWIISSMRCDGSDFSTYAMDEAQLLPFYLKLHIIHHAWGRTISGFFSDSSVLIYFVHHSRNEMMF